jgi:hypothetical protein
MTNEFKLGDIDSEGYVRIHSYELGQLIRQANGTYNMLSDVNKYSTEVERLRAELNLLKVQRKLKRKRWTFR